LKIIVTGGAGFIGSAVCRYLVGETDAHVINIDKLTYAANLRSLEPIANNPRYHFIRADICDRAGHGSRLRQARARRRDAPGRRESRRPLDQRLGCVHSYQRARHAYAAGDRALLLDGPAQGARASVPLPACLDRRGVRLAGPEGAFCETTAYDPSSPYSASKAAADHLASAWHRTFGLPVVISNCSNNYGPYHFPEKLIPLVLLNALDGKTLPVYGDGSNVRDWLYVEDHARALHVILTRGRLGEKYNVGGGNERTNLRIVESICDILDHLVPDGQGRRRLITFVADRPGHDHRYAIDASKLETELGWRAQETFETGLAKTVRWYLDNRAWWEPLRKACMPASGWGWSRRKARAG
jgi:dTDP-glucose 4,6-dehydratase